MQNDVFPSFRMQNNVLSHDSLAVLILFDISRSAFALNKRFCPV